MIHIFLGFILVDLQLNSGKIYLLLMKQKNDKYLKLDVKKLGYGREYYEKIMTFILAIISILSISGIIYWMWHTNSQMI